MKKTLRCSVVLFFVVAGGSLSLGAGSAITSTFSAAAPSSSRQQNQEQPAERIFRNIQVLKGVPASQLQPVMALFTGSLGVRCGYCHTNRFEEDAKPNKQTARRMIQMVMGLNKETFDGKNAVTCYTCHRGQENPSLVVALGINLWQMPAAPERTEPPLPTTEQILDRYVQAIGGKEALAKLASRISRGSRIGADGVLVPEEVYQKAPDKMLIVTSYPGNVLRAGFNGKIGWNSNSRGVGEISGEELADFQRQAAFNKELSVGELYSGLHPAGRASIGDREAYVLESNPSSGDLERLYFDVATGLLVREYKESKTALGPFPRQTDYQDYRMADGVMIPLTIRWAMPGRTWDRRIAEVIHNAPIEDEIFSLPAKR